MLRIPKTLCEDMIAHCRSAYPKEACGLLAGRDGVVEQVYLMTNVEDSPIGYSMDPKEQLQVMKAMRERRQEMLAIYHSHTASAAYPSPVDVRLAVYPEVSYVLVSLKEQARPEIKSYQIQDRRITAENLQVQD